MTVRTSAGTTLQVSAAPPATFDAIGYEALTMTLVGEVSDLGEFGREYNLVTFNPVGSRGTVKKTRLQRMGADGIVPDMPGICAPWIIDMLMDIGPSEPGAMGPVPLSWATIAHWQSCMGVDLAPWLCRLLRRLSIEYVTESQNAREPDAAVKIGLIGGVTVAKVASDTTMAASDTARAGVEQGNSIITTGVKAVEAVVNAIRSLPFPLNIAAGAVTAGVIASLGVAIGGAFGGGGNAPAPANEGTGTVFGDSAAKSESIAKAIDHLREVNTLTMRYSAAMLASLRSIEANIGGLTNLIIRANGGEASAAGIQTGFKGTGVTALLGGAMQKVGSVLDKIPVIGGLLGGVVGAVGKLIGSLFGTKTKITGQGIYGGAQSLADILSGGFDASYFSDVQKKKKFLGITTSTRYSTQYSAASAELERQFSLIFTGFHDAIVAAAGPLGLSIDAVEARLQGFVVNIGKIDLKGLTGTQIQEKLAAVFGAAADSLARYAIAGLDQFQQVGEGYFETLIRVASSVEAVTSAMTLLGRSTQLTIAASMDLVELFGSVSDMTTATGEYFALYYTGAEQVTARTAQMTSVLASLGIAMPGSIAGFRALVEAQDLTTEAGRAAYVALIQLAPAFADLVGAAQDGRQHQLLRHQRRDQHVQPCGHTRRRGDRHLGQPVGLPCRAQGRDGHRQLRKTPVQQDHRPTVSDETVPINDDLEINYGLFKNGFTFHRAANSWRLWPMLEFVPPKVNLAIAEMYDAGVEWTLCEHVSVAINGWADYVFEGPKGPITQRWTPGYHNVENGGGYLPAGEFTRRFHDDFTLCCVVQKFRRTPGVQYHFEVVTGPDLLDRGALFAHYATGVRQKQTDFDLPAGQTLDVAAGDITIIGRLR